MRQYDFSWEREAMKTGANGRPAMPDGLPLYEQAAFQAVAYLYARYNLGKIEKDAASREKKLIKYAMEERKKAEAFEKRLLAHRVAALRDTEMYRAEYRKAKTPEEALAAADRLVQAIDGIAASHPVKVGERNDE